MKTRLSSQYFEIAAAAGLLLLRLFTQPLVDIWWDWVVILALFWIITVFTRESRAWPVISLVTMLLLMTIYAWGQIPHTIGILGIGP